jgi:Flp pilus assembly protein TadD
MESSESIQRLGLEFLVEFYGEELARHPDNEPVRFELAHLFTRLGRYAEGLAVDRELVARHPEDAIARYNLACSLALTGALEEALERLEESVELGYEDGPAMAADPDLERLRGSARFQALLARLLEEPPG